MARDTVWILGDQLSRTVGALRTRTPGDCRVLLVTSEAKTASKRWHRQRLHVVLSAMAHFAQELRELGFEVDHRTAPSLTAGLEEHRREYEPTRVIAMEPMSWKGRALLEDNDVTILPNEQFTCSYDLFAEWANGRTSLRMEDFYRWQRVRLDVLMESDDPSGGRWNFDHSNREPPPTDGRAWPEVTKFELDSIDHDVLESMSSGAAPPDLWGSPPDGTWPVTRAQAVTRLEEFIAGGLALFGPHEDAMLGAEWKLAHSALACSLNLGLLHPLEVVEAAEGAYRAGSAPIHSVEGFIRQVIGWREYVWGVYWLWMPEYKDSNGLEAHRAVPPAFLDVGQTQMACVSGVVQHVHDHGYAHHIERLMILGNLALTAGVSPGAMTEWMWASFVDAAEWVMLPNVVGMALHADGGRMATKPYSSGGAYINRMSDYCGDCRYNPRKRTGDNACPFTTLYWDFLARHEEDFRRNHRMARQLAGMRRLGDLDEVKERAVEVLTLLDIGEL